jgi:hypothetical protein
MSLAPRTLILSFHNRLLLPFLQIKANQGESHGQWQCVRGGPQYP